MPLPKPGAVDLCRPLACLLGTRLERLWIRTNRSQPQSLSLSSPQSLIIRPCILATESSLAEQLIHLPSASMTPCEWEMRGSHLLLWQPGSWEEGGAASPPRCLLDGQQEPRHAGTCREGGNRPDGCQTELSGSVFGTCLPCAGHLAPVSRFKFRCYHFPAT